MPDHTPESRPAPDDTAAMPVLFVGHGTPMNAIEDNAFAREWRRIAQSLPKPEAVLCISAHWETRGTLVTAMARPRTIHDFGGFPRELYEVEYPAPGSAWLSAETKNAVSTASVGLDHDWGLDHGCWSVLRRMFPNAGIPVVQLSLDHSQPATFHYELGRELAPLRRRGVLIIGSGNLVHNLGEVSLRGDDFNEPFGYDWAIEANDLFKNLINENRHRELADYQSLGNAVQRAVPTPEHYLPMLYAIALKQDDEVISYFNDSPVAGSLTMTSLIIGA